MVYQSLWSAKLEPFLACLHEIAIGKPSLALDFLELCRFLMDDFILDYARNLKPLDFVLRDEDFSANRKGKRQYLNERIQYEYLKRLNSYFLSMVEVPRMRRGERQELETLISEEAFLFAQYLRKEKQTWVPRIANLVD